MKGDYFRLGVLTGAILMFLLTVLAHRVGWV